MHWHGPYQVRRYLEGTLEPDRDWPPDTRGIYVVTLRRWRSAPKAASDVLYIGGNTGKSDRFRTRIGDLLADMMGFFTATTAHHSGGQRLFRWCTDQGVNPLDLYLGWCSGVRCGRCAEMSVFLELKPRLNKNRPSVCPVH